MITVITKKDNTVRYVQIEKQNKENVFLCTWNGNDNVELHTAFTLKEVYTDICIKFHKDYHVIDFDTNKPVNEICAKFVDNDQNVAPLKYSDVETPSITSTTDEVEITI